AERGRIEILQQRQQRVLRGVAGQGGALLGAQVLDEGREGILRAVAVDRGRRRCAARRIVEVLDQRQQRVLGGVAGGRGWSQKVRQLLLADAAGVVGIELRVEGIRRLRGAARLGDGGFKLALGDRARAVAVDQ